MDSQWAAEHLQTIRTLMERSALYRRALAPVMIVSGGLGLLGAGLSWLWHFQSNRAFSLYWMAACLLAAVVALLQVRGQAIKEHEPFWSPPTRRVTQALFPAFFFGLCTGLCLVVLGPRLPPVAWLLAAVWTVTYGFALHAAGFFVQRGIKFFGWLFVVGGSGLLAVCLSSPTLQASQTGHCIMGTFFGLLHLSYGIYLYFTEPNRTTA